MNNNDFVNGDGWDNGQNNQYNQVANDSYRATSNLNTAIENPSYDVNNAMGVNINNVGMDSYYSGDGDDMNQGQFIPNNSSSIYMDDSDSSDSSYEPVMEENKKGNGKITISREFQITLFIVFILLLFIFLMPYIYDFFKDMQLIITS